MNVASGGAASAATDGWQPHIVALVCNWCSYAGADMAGTTRLEYPATVRLVRFPCTGRMNPMMIVKAFDHGADGVLVSGCHPGDCHYVQGNLVARRRFTLFRSLMDFMGLEPGRLHFAWVSASEGHKWAKVVSEVSELVHRAGPLPPWEGNLDGDPIRLPGGADAAEPDRMADGELVDRMRLTAANLLDSGEVDLFMGYRASSRRGRMAPAMIDSADQVGSLDWGVPAVHNLSVYLKTALERAGRVGMLVKQCDVPAVDGLVRENQIDRKDVVLVGVPCDGVVDDGVVPAKCGPCSGEVHPTCEVSLTASAVMMVTKGGDPDLRDQQVAYLEGLPANDRWRFWQGQFRRCIRCYACRAACPLCYCSSCIAEKHRPQWIPTTIDSRGNTSWNAIRAAHLAGRCTGCDECARACPADIRLDLLNRKMALEVERHFGSGLSPEERAALTEFRMDDPEEFIL
jgi:coenzyme F420-reducing hydrogenase delta subunit/ferredoxin